MKKNLSEVKGERFRSNQAEVARGGGKIRVEIPKVVMMVVSVGFFFFFPSWLAGWLTD